MILVWLWKNQNKFMASLELIWRVLSNQVEHMRFTADRYVCLLMDPDD